jgi:Kef-type K+ transport system membrane component KefB
MEYLNGDLLTGTDAVSRILSSSDTEDGVIDGVDPLLNSLSLFFVQATIIIGICRALSLVGTYLNQPRVIFEIIGGILLGPSAIGRNQDYLSKIFPTSSLSNLSIVANIGLTLYLFLVGLELDPKLLMSHLKNAGGIAISGMAVPFALGIAISGIMFNVLERPDPEFKDVKATSFFVFIGTAMSITAFPVLARILKEGGLMYTRPGAMTMGAAALNDAIAWCLLTLAISIGNNADDLSSAGYVFLIMVGFTLILFFIIRPLFAWLVEYVEAMHSPAMNSNLFALTLCILFMCAWTTLDSIFGAFVFGLIIPRGSHLMKECVERMEELVVTFTLPLYFALSGLKTDVTTIRTQEEGAITVLVVFCACIGKFIGAGGMAYMSGMNLRETGCVAALMNTRGLVELIVLNLGLNAKILNIRTFSVMVIMCLFTTFIASPLVELVYPKSIRVRVDESLQKDSSDPKDARIVATAEDGENAGLEMVQFCTKYAHRRIAVVVDTLPQTNAMVSENITSFCTTKCRFYFSRHCYASC